MAGNMADDIGLLETGKHRPINGDRDPLQRRRRGLLREFADWAADPDASFIGPYAGYWSVRRWSVRCCG